MLGAVGHRRDGHVGREQLGDQLVAGPGPDRVGHPLLQLAACAASRVAKSRSRTSVETEHVAQDRQKWSSVSTPSATCRPSAVSNVP